MPAYTPPRVTTTRQQGQSSVVLSVGGMIPCFIGTTNGRKTVKQAFAAQMGASTTYTLPSLLPDGPATRIAQIRSKVSGGIAYVEGTDYTFNESLQQISWLDAALPAPYITAIVETTGTSALVSGTTYYYLIAAYKTKDMTGPTVGETVASNEVNYKVSASGRRLKLTWQPTTGAEGYKVYRSTVSGNFTGSTLIATLAGEFTTSYEDAGGAASAGSPLGVAVYAQVVAANPGPYNLEPGQTLQVSVNGTADQVATFNATRAARTGVGASYPVSIVGASNDTLAVAIDGGETQTITLSPGSYTLAQLVSFINAFPLVGGFVDDDGGQLRISSDRRGSGVGGSSVQIVGGLALATIGHSAGTSYGTGNVANIDAVTAAEVVAVLTAIPLTGAAAALSSGIYPSISNSVAGLTYTLQITGGTANAAVGFPTSLVTGNTAAAATAVRRPALNATVPNFWVDYEYVRTEHLKLKRFTSLKDVQNEHGVGSNLFLACSLAMGTSGQGNAAPAVLTMSVADDTLPSYTAALAELEKSKEPTFIVPCTVVSGINGAVKSHVDLLATQYRRRLGIVGTPIGVQPGDTTTPNTAVYIARQLDHKRMILAYPWPVSSVQAQDGTWADTELDGWAQACIVAGRFASLPDRATPLTKKELNGIVRLGLDLDYYSANVLAEAGVMVIEDDLGVFRVRDSLTTTDDNGEDRQPGIVLVEDQLATQLETDFKQFIGAKLLPDTLAAIGDRTVLTLRLFTKLQLITSFDEGSIDVSQDPDVLTTVNVSFTYRPVQQLKEIAFKYTFDLSALTLSA